MHLSNDDLFLLTQCAISAAFQAGQVIRSYSSDSVTVETKANGGSYAAQVVTAVDHASQEVIVQVLQATCQRFDLALLSEEAPDDLERLHKDYFWCIDPLDGTLPFIEGVPGYSVSIALVARDGTPMIGVVYDPLEDGLYHALKNRGAYYNGQLLTSGHVTINKHQPLTFISDKSLAQEPIFADLNDALEAIALHCGYPKAELKLQGGAAMNACQVLRNPSSCYFKWPKSRPGGGSLWDYAATACLFHEAGLPVSDSRGEDLQLNPDGSLFMNHCGVLYAGHSEIAQAMTEFYQKIRH
jgi:myo-inositol-1(or 4)-monophosphatase